ncbi:MAG: XRE family transcriptional regulator [Marivivens sp.]|nr:XRE family transcriptional regulator [Marivivens sp.]
MIKEKRLELGYTQDELANKLQIFKQQLSNIETGRIRIPYRHIKNISNVLKIPMMRIKPLLGGALGLY